MQSLKYPRTYHFPFSPGTTSDDKVIWDYESLIGKELVITEKLDGENTCINQYGIFARSHAAPTQNPWASYLWEKWNILKNEIGDLDIFGESLYAIHSIEYSRLEHYFFVFGIRQEEHWFSWEELELYADLLNLPLVPVLHKGVFNNTKELESQILELASKPSSLTSTETGLCPREGLVARVTNAFDTEVFSQSVMKWVRKGHVQTDEHWTKNWKRAKLFFESKPEKPKK